MGRKGKQGEPDKTPKIKVTKPEKTRNNTGKRGARRTVLTEVEKVLIGNGGMGHSRLRKREKAGSFPKRRRDEVA